MYSSRAADTTGREWITMTPLRIFVRRGALRRFHRLKQEAEGLPVKVEWDRRMRDRRDAAAAKAETPAPPTPTPTEQRRAERRREPPFTWRAAEFVVVDEPKALDESGHAQHSSDSDDPDET